MSALQTLKPLIKLIERLNNQINDDPIFILTGEDENEFYLIDDKATIARLEAKVKELKGKSETEIAQHLRCIVNPQKYGNE
jgi:hypothetical protein